MDEKKSVTQVINLEDVRRARQQEQNGGDDAQFCFNLRDDLAEDDAPLGYVGGMVTILLEPNKLTGIAFSPGAARRLGVALIECAKLAEMDEEGMGEIPPESSTT